MLMLSRRAWCAGMGMGALLWTACAPVPLSDGTFKQLPTSGTPLLVWGYQPSVVDTAVLWFHSHRVPVIEPAQLQQRLNQELGPEAPLADDTVVLKVARELRANQVAFLHQAGDLRAPAVFVRGVDVASGEVVWAGTSRYSDHVADPIPHTLSLLTCLALQAAWQVADPERKECRMVERRGEK